MAANDYYHDNQLPSAPASSTPYYGVAYDPSSQRSTPAPPYSSTTNLPGAAQKPGQTSHGSPFDSVFDDHVYPLSSRPQGSQSNMGQTGPYSQDTGYYSQAAMPPDDGVRPGGVDDIPLQNRPPKDIEMNDHVYDAAGPSRASRDRKKKRGKIAVGQLGMFGADRKRIPWVVYIFTIVQVGVFIGEVARNAILTGSPIMIKPTFNPMIGPSTFVMIEMGARYVPCMHNVMGIQNETVAIGWPCPNSTTTDITSGSNRCSLKEICAFGGTVPNPDLSGDIKQNPEPNQWFRFILPMFLHAGLIHIGFNMLLQMTLGKEMEMAIGSIRFFLVYISAGIFGFVMGGNYAAPGVASTGASGSLFGIIALTLLDLLYSWKERRNPVKDLMFIFLDIAISFVLGLLPGLDNFSHIGGFLMGLCLGICVLHSPNSLRRRIGNDSSYSSVDMGTGNQGPPPFLKNPVGFFKGRKPLWWAWWLVRVGALVLVIVVFIVLLNNFYIYRNTCSWCKYLSCINVNGWCDLGNIRVERVPEPSSPTVRALLRG